MCIAVRSLEILHFNRRKVNLAQCRSRMYDTNLAKDGGMF